MIRAFSRCLSTLPILAASFAILSTTALAQSRAGDGSQRGSSTRQITTFGCAVVGPDRVCGGSSGLTYTGAVSPPTPGVIYSWSLSTTTTGGCLGIGSTNPSFCGPTDQPTVCVLPGNGAGRFALILVVTAGGSSSTCCLSINVTPTTTTTPLVAGQVCAGDPFTFCTTASGVGPFTYVWEKNGAVIPGATDSCYTATAPGIGLSDLYCVTTTGSGVCANSMTTCANLSGLVATSTTPLPDVRRCEGATFQFCTDRNIPGPYTFSWTKNGTTIPGATNDCYTATAGPPGTQDAYCVTVQGPCGPPVTRCGTLTTNDPTSLTDLTNGAVCSGDAFQFCTTASGTGPFTYSWTKDGTTIPGATDSCYTATAGPPQMIEEYCVTATGPCGSATECGLLRALANTSTTQPAPHAACEGDVHTFCTTPSGIGPFTYSWTKNGNPIAGATNNCYPAFAPAPGVTDTYCVTVTGVCGPPVTQCTTFTGNLATTATPMASASECAGSPHTFCTTPGGTGPFVYAWKKNNIFIPGANGPCYTAIAPPAGQQPDLYSVLVTGACNTVTRTATLGGIICLGGTYVTLTHTAFGEAQNVFNDVTTGDLVEQLLFGDLTVGITGVNSLTFVPNGHDSGCVTSLLPQSGVSAALPAFGDETLEQDCQTTPIPLPIANGRLANILLGQVTTLSLNLRLSEVGMTSPTGCVTIPTDLLNQGVCQTMVSRTVLPGPDGWIGTSDDVVDLLGPDGDPSTADNIRTVTFPDAVIVSLNELQLTQTVGGLVALGNLALAGEPTYTATIEEISAAVDSLNIIFEEGRETADCSHP